MALVQYIETIAVVSPRTELHFTILRVKWEILNVDATFALESDGSKPNVLSRVMQYNSEV